MSVGNLNKTNYDDSSGKYKFRQAWGGSTVDSSGINKEVIWTQTSWLTDSTIQGFAEIGTSGYVGNSSSSFYGLGKSSDSSCVIDGNGGSGSWHNCAGSRSSWGGGIPGPLGKVATRMYLYIWNASGSANVAVSSSNTSEGTVSPSTLPFTQNNFDAPQTVTVTGVDDSNSDGHQHYGINLSAPALSAHIVSSGTCEAAGFDRVTSAAGCLAAGAITSPKINGGAASDQPTNGYSDSGSSRTAGCTVHNWQLSAGGTTQFFPNASGACGTAQMNCICTESSNSENVQVELHNLDNDINVLVDVASNNILEATVNPSTLTFTPNNWNSNQTVTVTGVNDTISDGHREYVVSLSSEKEADNPVVTTVAGSGSSGSTDGTGTSTSFVSPYTIANDGTNLYVGENHKIRKIVIATGVVTTLAGSTSYGFADGTGTSARFNYPRGMVVVGSNLYVADGNNFRIRKVKLSTGVVTTLAGSSSQGSTDGTGTSAKFKTLFGLGTDGTNLYVPDLYNYKIRKIVISTGVVTTLAGSGSPGSTDATGTSASFNYPIGATSDGINVYVAEYSNHKIRKIVISTGVVTTLAGLRNLWICRRDWYISKI